MMTEIPPGRQSIMAEFPLGLNGAYRGPRLLLYYPVNPDRCTISGPPHPGGIGCCGMLSGPITNS